jgi:hypothetical protein
VFIQSRTEGTFQIRASIHFQECNPPKSFFVKDCLLIYLLPTSEISSIYRRQSYIHT